MASKDSRFRSAHQLSWRQRMIRELAKMRADVSFAVVDAFLIVVAYIAAFGLRFFDPADGVDPAWWDSLIRFLPMVVIVYLLTNLAFGAYGHIWEYASVSEAQRVVYAVTTATAVLLIASTTYARLTGAASPVPRSVIVMGGLLALIGQGVVRFRSRLFSLRRIGDLGARERTLVVGTGATAFAFARSTIRSSNTIELVGFVGVHRGSTVRYLAGRPVYGSVHELPDLVDRLNIERVVIAAGERDGLARRVVDMCMASEVHLSMVPDVGSLATARTGLRDVRDLELDDLLVRPRVDIDLQEVAHLLEGKSVLVTGAGGSIGSEIARQIIGFAPRQLIVLDNDETHLHESRLRWPDHTNVIPALCDIRDRAQLRRVLEETQPQVIFHAAAHKHVPILEQYPEEAIKTNVIGTANVLDIADEVCDLELFVLISTDKAVDPAGAMGASKRIAEMLIQARANGAAKCKYTAVRFGNVLGSRGSVVPTFISQVKAGGPVTVTDPDMTRYFMTISEAVQLVLQAAALADGGEVFVLDMGEPVRIGELARRLIRLAGLVPDRDIEVITVGKRPGEKMDEILSKEPLESSSHPKIGIARPSAPGPATVLDLLDVLQRAVGDSTAPELRELLHGITHSDWDTTEVIHLTPIEETQDEQSRRLA